MTSGLAAASASHISGFRLRGIRIPSLESLASTKFSREEGFRDPLNSAFLEELPRLAKIVESSPSMFFDVAPYIDVTVAPAELVVELGKKPLTHILQFAEVLRKLSQSDRRPAPGWRVALVRNNEMRVPTLVGALSHPHRGWDIKILRDPKKKESCNWGRLWLVTPDGIAA